MFRKILIANRGEIAVRIAAGVRELGARAVAVYTDVDRASLHVRSADEAHGLGPDARAYLDAERLLELARRAGADALHPGYGFLSENAEFAALCETRGVTFIGPPSHAIRDMGSKERARALMQAAGVPIVPGGSAKTLEEARATAARVGYPVLVKAVAGGGGKGMRLCASEAELPGLLERARSEAKNAFGDSDVYLEKALERARHVEVQVLGDRHGALIHLYERDCSLQRRHQKIVEETPCPVLDPKTRARLCAVALEGARAIGYYSAGTFEFLLAPSGDFYFLEMNTRLQVEHPITELVTGVDLVREMIRIAAGEPLIEAPEARGAAIEVRLCAEDPERGFVPSPGTIERRVAASGPFLREDSGVEAGSLVGSDYDPLLSKLCAFGRTREEALARLRRALADTVLAGPHTNLRLLERLLDSAEVRSGDYDTGFVERHLERLLEHAPEDLGRDRALAAALALFAEQRSRTSRPRSERAPSPWVLAERGRWRER